MLKGLLEQGANKALVMWLQQKFGEYADVKQVKLDMANKACHASFTLHGDTEEILLSVTEYMIEKSDDAHVFKINKVECSKIWADRLVQNYLAGKEYKLPAVLSNFL